MRRTLLILALAAAPAPAAAHAVERGLILLLPTEYYLLGGAAAVAISFAVLALSSADRLATILMRSTSVRIHRLPTAPLPWFGFFIFWALIAAGSLGARDPLANPLPLIVWTVWWIGFTAVVALIGDLWRPLNPWSAPMSVMRRLLGPPLLTLPTRLGYWPAILGFGAVVWFEIVDLAPDDPARLARAAALYWLVQFAAMLLFGETAWRGTGEAFSVLYRLIGQLAPVTIQERRVSLSLPGARLVSGGALPLSGWLFICLTVSAVTFDGLSGTFWWMAWIGINPLEFPGRSAVIGENTAGLIGVWVAMSAAFALTVTSGWAFAGRRVSLAASLGRIALSLLPIALAYHLSHYLTYFLVNGQYALVAATDPLGTGADWLGLGAWPVTTSFLNNLEDVELIWRVQVAMIVIGHLLAVVIAHAIALDLYRDRRIAALSQIPLAVLMVAYTVLGLWLLSTPTAV